MISEHNNTANMTGASKYSRAMVLLPGSRQQAKKKCGGKIGKT